MCASHCFWTLVPVFLSWICKTTTLFSEHWHCRHPLPSLCGYGDSKIDLVGSLQVTVGYGNKMVPRFTFHCCPSWGQPDGSGFVLGSGIFPSWHEGSCDPRQSPRPWQQKWPSLFEGLGCLTAFAHQPLLNPAINQSSNHSDAFPWPLRDGVSAELKQLQDIGHYWTSGCVALGSQTLVVAQKKSGALRVCVGLRCGE